MATIAKRDIRKEVKKYIDQADDRMVKIIHTLLVTDKEEDWWDEIGEGERASIDLGLQQLKEGKGIPHEEVVKQYSKWFVK